MEPEPEPIKKKRRKKGDLARKTFELGDAELATKSRVWHSLFIDHLAQFEAFDPHLNMAFANSWLAQIDALEGTETDETFVDGQQQVTSDVKDATAPVQLRLDRVEYFVKAAYPNKPRILQEFGFDKMRNPAAMGIARFVLFGYTLLLVLEHYQAGLLTAGMPATLPAELETALDKLGELEIFQEYQKRVRIRTTTDRINKFNDLYEMHVKVSKAAHIIFYKEPVIAAQYDL